MSFKEQLVTDMKRGGRRKVYAEGGNKPCVANMHDQLALWIRIPGGHGRICRLFGQSVIQAMGGLDNHERLRGRAKETFEKRLRHDEVSAVLAGHIRGGT